MKDRIAKTRARISNYWDRYKRPVKRLYQVPAIGVAFLYRRVLTQPLFVAVTGSLGKTQVKALTAAVLEQRGSVRFDPSTDNRTYDAAKNLLKTHPAHTACIQEIGLAGPGTMARPVNLFRPDVSLITNVRSDHSADFATRHEHVLEKASVIRDLPDSGWAVLNADEPDLPVLVKQTSANIVTYGFSDCADVRAVRVDNRPPRPLFMEVEVDGKRHAVETQLHGAHNAYSVLAALTTGIIAGVAPASAAAAIAKVPSVPGRMQFTLHEDGVAFLLDDFKASSGSLSAIADYLRDYDAGTGRKILALGTIMYGSDDAASDYVTFVEKIADYCDKILLVGSLAGCLSTGLFPVNVRSFKTVESCASYLDSRLRPGDLVVVKCRNSDDHLRRIEIRRRGVVNCWQMSCARKSFCDDCVFLKQNLV